MPGHRSLAWIVPPLLLAAALPAAAWSAGPPPSHRAAIGAGFAIGLDGPAPPASTPAALPACSPAAAAIPAAAIPAAAISSPTTPANPPWFQLAGRLDGDGTLTGWDLLATAGGGSVRLWLPPESAVRGPVNGWLSIAVDDGLRSEIRLVSPAAGCSRLVRTSGDVIRQAILAPDGGSVVYHAVGRSDRADLGTWRVSLSSSDAERLVAPLDHADPALRDVGLVWTTDLRAASAGRGLAVQSCGEDACRIRIAGLETPGASIRRVLPGTLVGFGDRHVVTLRDCDGGTCSLVASAMGSGRDRTLARGIASATAAVVDGRLVVVASGPAAGSGWLIADPDTGASWTVQPPSPEGGSLAPGSAEVRWLSAGGETHAGVQLPPGWAAGLEPGGSRIVPLDVAATLAAAHAAGSEETTR